MEHCWYCGNPILPGSKVRLHKDPSGIPRPFHVPDNFRDCVNEYLKAERAYEREVHSKLSDAIP